MEHPENYFLDWKLDYQNYSLKHFSQEIDNYIITIYIILGLFRGLNIKGLETVLIVAMEMILLFKQFNNHMLDGKLHGINRTLLFSDFY